MKEAKLSPDSCFTMDGSRRYDESSFKQPSGFRKLSDMIPARVVLYMLSFSGFLVSFMMRTDINLTIVAMVKTPLQNNTTDKISTHCHTTNDNTSFSVTPTDTRLEEAGEFDWDPVIQASILGSFYWCYILSQVVGGVLTQYFGTKTVFGGSQLITAICSLLMPTAAEMHYGAMIALRSIQGIASGLTWPAMYAIVGYWIPPHERSRFMSSFQAPNAVGFADSGVYSPATAQQHEKGQSILPTGRFSRARLD